MNPFATAFQLSIYIFKKETIKFFKRHWFNVLILISIIYFTGLKNIDFELSLSTSTMFDPVESIASKELSPSEKRTNDPKLTSNYFSIGGFSFNSKKNDNETTKIASQPKTDKSENKLETTSHPFFLSFIFHHDPSGKHPLDPALVIRQQEVCNQYIKRFAPVVVSEMHKYGIPASIKMAQALLESNVGKHPIALKNNNHFGIKCFAKNCKTGHCSNYSQNAHKEFYRKYENAWTSFRGHSTFLQSPPYAHLKSLGIKDYKAWANGLEQAGYSTDPLYREKLVRIIEYFALDQLD